MANIVSDPNHAQALNFGLGGDAAGNSVTAWTYLPLPADQQRPEYGLYYRTMSYTGVVGGTVKLESFDWDQSDLYTSGLDGPVSVGVAPNGAFAIAYVRGTAHFPTPTAQYADWTSDALYVRTFSAGGVAQGGRC